MSRNDTKIDKQMRKAMDAIDAIAAMEDADRQERMDALSRIGAYAVGKWNQELNQPRRKVVTDAT